MPLLDWLNKDQAVKQFNQVPYRLLQPVPELSVGDPNNENMLIQGDNLDALKALLPLYAGKVKCIYIDPPYNTKSAFEHYDDNLEHSQWLSMMYPRLELLRELLSEDGSIWVNLDKGEGHYLKVMLDEIFGRKNFIGEVIWQKRTSRENRAAVGSAHDNIFVYAKMEAVNWKKHRNLLPPNDKGYSNPDNDPKGKWRSIPFSAQGFRKNQMYEIETPTGVIHNPPKGRCWGATEPEYKRLLQEDRVYFPKNGAGKPRTKKYPWEDEGLVPMSIWLSEDAGTTEDSKKEIMELFDEENPFATPKPEKLISQIMYVATNKSDLVLDSFLGSGTTAAVAHKMNRRYIGIEMGEHAETHCQPRLKKVIEGEQGGISKAVGWQGGGGFHYYRLGEPIFDEYGCIRGDIRFAELAAHVWYMETRTPLLKKCRSPLLGIHNGVAYYLLYNGILGDRKPQGGNVLTGPILSQLAKHDGPKVIFGETSRLGEARLKDEQITFKQIPYDVRAR